MQSLKKLKIATGFVLLGMLAWIILKEGFGSILSFSFYLDDWPLIWGVSQQKGLLFNPLDVNFYFAQERFAVREGYLQILLATILYKLNGLNPYWYHLTGLIAKFTSVMALAWAGWKLTKRFSVGFIAGVLFASVYSGSESLYWFNVSAIYFFIVLVFILIPFFIEGLRGDKKSWIISLVLISVSILLYSPRAHILLALPIVGIFWTSKVNKNFILKTTLVLLVIFFSFKIFFAEAGTGQASRAILHRLNVFTVAGLNEGKRMFLTYPVTGVGFSLFPEKLIGILTSIPKNNFIFAGIPITSFRLWNFIFFPLLWTILIVLVSKAAKNQNKRTVFWWLAIGYFWFLINGLLRKFFFTTDWEWRMHFLFISVITLFLFSAASFHFFKKNKNILPFAQVMLSSLILAFVGYFFNWAFDPLVPPDSISHSRYLTLPSAFTSLFGGALLGGILFYLHTRINNGNKFSTSISKLSIVFVIFYSVFWVVTANIEKAREFINGPLREARQKTNVENILNKISADVEFGYPPPIILLDSWDYAEVFAVIIYSGHSLALWNNIYDTNQFPLIYYDERKLAAEFKDLCLRYPGIEKKVFRFKVENDRAVKLSPPKVSCFPNITKTLNQ